MTKIESTSDYKRFNNLSYNRKNGINKVKFEEIKDSISDNNYLNLHPIIVNEKFDVIDGQHRLAAAQSLGVPIFYVQEEGISDNHVLNANTAKSNWNIEDVINYYSSKDRNTNYIFIDAQMSRLKLKTKGFFGLIFGVTNYTLFNLIKRGSFKLPENMTKINELLLNYERLLLFLNQRRVTPISMFRNASFTQAFRLISLNELFDINILLKKLENKWFDLKPQINSKEWYKLLLDIYNWNNRLNRLD